MYCTLLIRFILDLNTTVVSADKAQMRALYLAKRDLASSSVLSLNFRFGIIETFTHAAVQIR